MDKRRDVRRGASRFKHSEDKFVTGLDGIGGNSVCSAKLKKESLKRLRSVGRASVSYEDFEMGCGASEREDYLHSVGSSQRFKLPNKFFDDYNGINHSSVPRKLRSAMKKRNRESISPPLPDLKKLNHTTDIESPKMDCAKKFRPCMKQVVDSSPRQTESPTITKDEEEVVKTLYALASGLFADNDGEHKPTLDDESVEANGSTLPKSKESQLAKAEVDKLGLSSICSLANFEAVNPSSSMERLVETAKNDSSIEIKGEDQSALSQNKKLCIKSYYSAAPINLTSCMSERCDMKPECDMVNFFIPSNLNMDSGVKPFLRKETPIVERKMEITSVLATTVGSQIEPEHVVKESKEIGLTLWPGVKSSTSQYGGTNGPSLQSSFATNPAWLDASLDASKNNSLKNRSSAQKVYEVTTGRRSYKRCAAHVYISHLIHTLHLSEGQRNCMRPQEVKLGVLLGVNKINGAKSGLNSTGAVSASRLGSSVAKENANRTKNSFLPKRRFHQDQPVSAPKYGRCTSQKQSSEFLSMSAGSSALQASDSFGRTRTDFEQISKIQVPYLPSLVQPQKNMPFSLPQSHCNPVYANLLSSAQQMPLPPCHVNPFYDSPSSPTIVTKQQYQLQQPQQQQQQCLWSTQCKSVGISAGRVQLTNWQNAKQEPPPFLPCAQGLLSPSPSALEAVGHKFAPLSQQQQMALSSSFYPGRIVKQDHNLPSIHEKSSSKLQTACPMPLQLLCNELL